MKTSKTKLVLIFLLPLILSCEDSGNKNRSSSSSAYHPQLQYLDVAFENKKLSVSTYNMTIGDDPTPYIYSYSVGTKSGAQDVIGWTVTSGYDHFFEITLNDLKNKTRYYVNMKTTHPSGRESSVLSDSFVNEIPSAFEWISSELKTPDDQIFSRTGHTAIWTGKEMIIWGGYDGITTRNTGYTYDPLKKSWENLSISNAPTDRAWHSAVWTGTEMIIWGGEKGSVRLNTGGAYNPSTKSWRTIPNIGAPTSRKEHKAVWTGTEMIIWGGLDLSSTGGKYKPSTNQWTSFSLSSQDARSNGTIDVIYDDIFIWGGKDSSGTVRNDGKIIMNNTISTLSSINAPSARSHHSSHATPFGLIIWGGIGSSGKRLNTGAIYNIASHSWKPITTVGAPPSRANHTSVWTGKEMIVWGGDNDSLASLHDVYSYDPYQNKWTYIDNSSLNKRSHHSAVWTGSEVLIWGGKNLNQMGNKLSITNSTGYCGDTSNFCYSDSFAANHARSVFRAITPKGREVIYTMNPHGVYLWKDALSDRVLKANGGDEWQRENDQSYSKVFKKIKARTCTDPFSIYHERTFESATCFFSFE